MSRESDLSSGLLCYESSNNKDLSDSFSLQATQLLKFREAPLVKESLSSLEKAVPSPKDEDEPVDGGMNKVISIIIKPENL